jgi:hypothetical protein
MELRISASSIKEKDKRGKADGIRGIIRIFYIFWGNDIE